MMWSQDAEEFYRQGKRYFAENNLDRAEMAFVKAVELRPAHALAWKALGVVFASRGNFERAEAAFGNACKIQPAMPDACLYYGRTLYLLNRFQPAIAVLHAAVVRDPENSEAYRLLGLSLEALGQSPDAGDAFLHAVRLNRASAANEDPGIDYGVFLFRQGRAEDAIEPLESALKRHPEAARAHLELGCIQLALDRLPDAAAHLERALALEPAQGQMTARAHLLLGKVYQRQGKMPAADEHLRLGSQTSK